MSLIYSTLTSIVNKISYEFHKSFLFSTIFSILTFIENQWVNSYFKRLYPSETFLNFLNKINIVKNHLFNPLIVILVFSIFLLLSIKSVTNSLAVTLLIGFIAFFMGSEILPRFLLNNNAEITIRFNRNDIYSIGFCLMLVSIVFFLVCCHRK